MPGENARITIVLDKRTLELFLQVHTQSLQIARDISRIIGPEDTEHFIRISGKLAQSGYHL